MADEAGRKKRGEFPDKERRGGRPNEDEGGRPARWKAKWWWLCGPRLSRNHAVEDAIKARVGSVCPGGTAVSAVLSGRDGRDARAPLATCQLAHQIVNQHSPRRASVAVPEMAAYFAWLRLSRIHAVEDAIKARLGSVCPGGTAVPAVLSGRDGRDARAPLATCQLAHQIVSQLSPRRASVAVPEMAAYFAWLRLSRIHAVEDAIKARLGSVCPGGTAVPAVLSGRDGRDARAPLATCQLAHQIVSQLSPRRASVAVPEMAECFAWLRLSRIHAVEETIKARLGSVFPGGMAVSAVLFDVV